MKKILSTLAASSIFFANTGTVQAVCPVCTVAVGAGLGLSRYFGIDDLVTGIWVGGLVISVSLWTSDWLGKKDFKIFKKFTSEQLMILSFAFWILFTYPPLALSGIIGSELNKVWGVDKLIIGSLFGAIAFTAGVIADKKARKMYGKQFFNYQKVAFPVLSLVIASILMYFYGGYIK
jgi:hypothetical protein